MAGKRVYGASGITLELYVERALKDENGTRIFESVPEGIRNI